MVGQTRLGAHPSLRTHQSNTQLRGVFLSGQHVVNASRFREIAALGQVHRLSGDWVLTFILHLARRQCVGLAGLAHQPNR